MDTSRQIEKISKSDQIQVIKTQPLQSEVERKLTAQDVLRMAAEEEAELQQLQQQQQQQELQNEINTFNLLRQLITTDINILESNYLTINDLLGIINNFSSFSINTTNKEEESLNVIVSNVNSKSQEIKANLNLLDKSINKILLLIYNLEN